MTAPRRLLALIAGGFILASMANVFWETRVVLDRQYENRALAFRADSRLVTLTRTLTNSSISKELYLLPAALLERARGGALLTPSSFPIDEYAIRNLARMTIETQSDPKEQLTDRAAHDLIARASLEGDGRLNGRDSDLVHWYLITDPDKSTSGTIRLFVHHGDVLLVDGTLLEDGQS